MVQVLRNIAYVCSEIWRNVGVPQKVSIILVGIVGLGAVSAIMYFGTRPNWHAAYSELDRKTASQIYEVAESENIPVKLKDGGSTVAVPYRHVNKLRTKAANQGIEVKDKGTGLELFGERKFGMTKMQQKIGFQRAMQGELERMIRGMRGVKDAKVLVAIPERDPFGKKEEQEGEASVFVEREAGYKLGGDEVATIREMVAGGIDRLSSDQVTVTNDDGRLLAKGGGMGLTAGGLDTQLKLKKQIESTIEHKAKSILRPLVGVGAVQASASVQLDLDQGQKTVESYQGDQSAVKRERRVTEESKEKHSSPNQAAGETSNVVSVENPEGQGASGDRSSSTQQVEETEYLVPKTTKTVKERGASISGMSVAVAVDKPEGGEARSSEELQRYKELVASAVGGSVTNMEDPAEHVTIIEKSFVKQEPAQKAEPMFSPEKILSYMGSFGYERIAGIFLGLVLLLFLYRGFKKTFAGHGVEQEDLPQMEWGGQIRSVGAGEGGVGEAHQESAAERTGFDTIKQRTRENPQLVAGAIESWIQNEIGGGGGSQ